jgi:hypothetical protein
MNETIHPQDTGRYHPSCMNSTSGFFLKRSDPKVNTFETLSDSVRLLILFCVHGVEILFE